MIGRSTVLLLAMLAFTAAAGLPRPAAPERTIHFTYTATVPSELEGATKGELWLPLPLESPDQRVANLRIEAPIPHEIVSENRFGNRMIRVSGPAKELAGRSVTVTFDVTRRPIEGRYKAASPEELAEASSANSLVPIDGIIADRAARSAEGKVETLEVARALYDDVVTSLRYDKSGTGWGRGDAIYACTVESGNCTDFHSLFIGMCRSLGIPARFAMGVPLPADEAEGTVPGYHCWAEFYVEGQGWIPVDASEASKHPERAEFLFGNLDADRIEFSRGRDITLPGREDKPLNYFIYPFLLADGVPMDGTGHRFSFRNVEEESDS